MQNIHDRTLATFPLGHLVLAVLAIGVAYASIVPGMVMDWYHDENYSHGFLVPLISGYFLWEKWPELKRARLQPSNAGLIVVAGSLLLLLLGFVGR